MGKRNCSWGYFKTGRKQRFFVAGADTKIYKILRSFFGFQAADIDFKRCAGLWCQVNDRFSAAYGLVIFLHFVSYLVAVQVGEVKTVFDQGIRRWPGR